MINTEHTSFVMARADQTQNSRETKTKFHQNKKIKCSTVYSKKKFIHGTKVWYNSINIALFLYMPPQLKS
uniref:Uncharacterized protein LOC105134496 n=1 Tax=Rhizophora mucronata TaxID=61149 RepID=A0A2P2L0U2_RHIMU